MVPFILRICLGASLCLAALTLENVTLAMLFPLVLEWASEVGKVIFRWGSRLSSIEVGGYIMP